MPCYSDEFKEQVVRQMISPNPQSVAQVHRETGISQPTLYAWRNCYRAQGQVVPTGPSNPESWSGENTLVFVFETAALNEQGLAEYCRPKGLYPEQIPRWREASTGGHDDTHRLSAAVRKKRRRLGKEPRRKDNVLADAGALLVLPKKPMSSGRRGGPLITPEDRQMAIDLIHEDWWPAPGRRAPVRCSRCTVVGSALRGGSQADTGQQALAQQGL